jgi:hypothetical protein
VKKSGKFSLLIDTKKVTLSSVVDFYFGTGIASLRKKCFLVSKTVFILVK